MLEKAFAFPELSKYMECISGEVIVSLPGEVR